MEERTCLRCGNADPEYFWNDEGVWYCRRCIAFGRIDAGQRPIPPKWEKRVIHCEYHLKYPLTAAQKRTVDEVMEGLNGGHDVLIYAATGAGKTELQKYLISQLDPCRRVIVIDNVEELELSRGSSAIDLTSWLVSPAAPYATYQDLIRAALRADPDYLIVAEARGKEMLDCLNSAFSGCPVITTLHSFDLESMPMRMARMALMGDPSLDMDALLGDIYHHFPLFVFVSKEEEGGKIVRHIDGIGYADEEGRRVARL